MTSVPAGRYPIRPTRRDLQELKESILGVATPETLDTLSEIAAALGDDPNYFTNVTAAIQAVQDDVNANEIAAGDLVTNLQAARELITNALASRLDTLETDPTTQSYVDGIQGTLSGRLDTLESDPTTQTAVDAKLNTANPAATGDLTVDTNARLQFDSNLTKVENVLRGTSINIGNNIELRPAAADGRVEIEGGLYIRLSDLEQHNNDTDAADAGIVVGGIYYDNNGHLKIRRS